MANVVKMDEDEVEMQVYCENQVTSIDPIIETNVENSNSFVEDDKDHDDEILDLTLSWYEDLEMSQLVVEDMDVVYVLLYIVHELVEEVRILRNHDEPIAIAGMANNASGTYNAVANPRMDVFVEDVGVVSNVEVTNHIANVQDLA